MKKVLLLLTVLWVAAVNVFGQNPTTLWENNGDIDWYNTQDSEFTLSTSAELSGLSILVASGNSFVGITISIGADLDLGAHLWTKIGIDHNAPFSGIFDGNNHIISNLIVDMPGTSFVGLFGRCFGATIQNVRLMNPFVRGKDSVGSLAGNVWDAVLVENCHATGVDVVATGDNIGGLVGDAYGPGEFIRCSSEGTVEGKSSVGGLLGSMFHAVTTSESFSLGEVYAMHVAGGLIGATLIGMGVLTSSINDCYSHADVEVVNGVAGGFYGSTISISAMENCYSTGTVTGPEYIGGFIGRSGNIPVENNYWDTLSSNLSIAIGDWISEEPLIEGITGSSTEFMKTASMADILNAGNANGPWVIDSSLNDGYPGFTQGSLSLLTYDKSIVALHVYPNLFDVKLQIETDARLISYVICEISGKVIQEGSLKGHHALLNTHSVKAGFYVLVVNTDQGRVSKRIVKQ